MDWNRVEGNWKQVTGKVKEKWGKLTDDDLTTINGRRDQLEGKIQERYGLAKDQVKKDVDDWYEQAVLVACRVVNCIGGPAGCRALFFVTSLPPLPLGRGLAPVRLPRAPDAAGSAQNARKSHAGRVGGARVTDAA